MTRDRLTKFLITERLGLDWVPKLNRGLIPLALSLILLFAAPVAGQGIMRIAAIVNDEVISIFDLDNRVRLVVVSSGVRPDKDNQQRFVQQVLRGLIDERLRLQEAERLNIRVSQREINREIAAIAQRNNMSGEQFVNQLQRSGIDPSTMDNQIRANIAWNKLAARQLRRDVNVSQEEVDEEIERLKANLSKPQKRVQEIFIGLDSPDEEAATRSNANNLVRQAREGAEFARLARAFSQSQSATGGGEIGWVSVGQLRPELDQALLTLGPGQVSDPIPTFSGYYILYVAEQREGGVKPGEAKLDLVQLIADIPSNPSQAVVDSVQARLNGLRRQINSCTDSEDLAASADDLKSSSAKGIRIADMPANLRAVLENAQVGETSEPVVSTRSAVLLTVCARSEFGNQLPDRDTITNRIGTERIDLLARRYMRDLRREAFIDIRL